MTCVSNASCNTLFPLRFIHFRSVYIEINVLVHGCNIILQRENKPLHFLLTHPDSSCINLSYKKTKPYCLLNNKYIKINNDPNLAINFQLSGKTNKTETKVFKVTVLIPEPNVFPPKPGLF